MCGGGLAQWVERRARGSMTSVTRVRSESGAQENIVSFSGQWISSPTLYQLSHSVPHPIIITISITIIIIINIIIIITITILLTLSLLLRFLLLLTLSLTLSLF